MSLRDDIDIEEFIASLRLDSGAHDSPEKGMCVLEAVSFVAGEPFSDHPECASEVIGAFMRRWNDDLDDEGRQRLKAYIPRLVGSRASAEVEQRRGFMVAEWLVRVHTPAWLRLAGISEAAEALEALPDLGTWDELSGWKPALSEANERAAAARAAAWAAAGAAAGDAAWAAARDAAWAAARDAAWAAAGDAARAAAGDAAWAAAWAAAGDAAGDAAWAAAGDAAGDAAWDALRPTSEGLQASAFELLDRMLALS